MFTTEVPSTVIDAAKGWLLDCGCPEELLEGRTDGEIVREVEVQYCGGWAGFLAEG